ncbi:hypothetical protein DVH05_002428 [Phytophthora capsici]|nr:hypothetical protein DVH05_002428 [Phytophthora capsici]
MAPRTVFALLKLDSLDTRGYAYGKTISEEQDGQYDIERVASGRWKDLKPLTTQRKNPEVDPREVTEAEALSGIGTYVGSALCVARVPQGRPKVWAYGMVVGYTWKEGSQSGVLQATFGEGTSYIEYCESEHQDLTLETYALQPCRYKSVTDIMPSEMRAIHVAIHDHFNGVWTNSPTKFRHCTEKGRHGGG